MMVHCYYWYYCYKKTVNFNCLLWWHVFRGCFQHGSLRGAKTRRTYQHISANGTLGTLGKPRSRLTVALTPLEPGSSEPGIFYPPKIRLTKNKRWNLNFKATALMFGSPTWNLNFINAGFSEATALMIGSPWLLSMRHKSFDRTLLAYRNLCFTKVHLITL